MGDTLGDPVMADGIEDMKEIIKIGFLNKDVCITHIFIIYCSVQYEFFFSCSDFL